jgi:hypothetical protein
MITKNKILILSSGLLIFLVLFNMGFSFYILREIDDSHSLIWVSIIFSGLLIVAAALFHRVGIEDGKVEGYLSNFRPDNG